MSWAAAGLEGEGAGVSARAFGQKTMMIRPTSMTKITSQAYPTAYLSAAETDVAS